jgi:hypothetical protein
MASETLPSGLRWLMVLCVLEIVEQAQVHLAGCFEAHPE